MMEQSRLTRVLRLRRANEVAPSARCPDEAEMAAFFDRSLGHDEARRMRLHLADCGSCRGEVAYLARSGEMEASPASPAVSRAGWRWAVAAAATLVFAIVWNVDRRSGVPHTEAERPPAPLEQVRGIESSGSSLDLLNLDEHAVLARSGLGFTWTESPEASVYEIRILTLDGRLVWNATVSGTSVVVPANVELEPGAYYVRVAASLAGGRRSSSPHRRFRIE